MNPQRRKAAQSKRTTEQDEMNTQPTMAKTLADCEDFEILWDQVDHVVRLDDEGCDLYTYPDGSQLKIYANHTVVI